MARNAPSKTKILLKNEAKSLILLEEHKKAAIMARNAPFKTKVLLKNDAKLLILLGMNKKAKITIDFGFFRLAFGFFDEFHQTFTFTQLIWCEFVFAAGKWIGALLEEQADR